MEKMRSRSDAEAAVAMSTGTLDTRLVTTDWRKGLPIIAGSLVTIRALHTSDAHSLLTMLTAEEVTRFISAPPGSVEAFERFIVSANCERVAGSCVSFAVVPRGMDAAIGLFQVRRREAGFDTAEWGFAFGSAFWGTGMFTEAARLVLEFSFGVVGVRRMEARATVQNGRGNGALRKLGATQEGVLRRAFHRGGQYYDQALWTIVSDEWTAAAGPVSSRIH